MNQDYLVLSTNIHHQRAQLSTELSLTVGVLFVEAVSEQCQALPAFLHNSSVVTSKE